MDRILGTKSLLRSGFDRIGERQCGSRRFDAGNTPTVERLVAHQDRFRETYLRWGAVSIV